MFAFERLPQRSRDKERIMRAILVGLGGRGQAWHRWAQRHEQTQVVACVEPVAENRDAAVREQGVDASTVYDSLERATDAVEADFVLDVTPPAVHRAVAEAAFARGLHVLGEKPISSDWADAKAMLEAGRSAGCVHMITQNYRFGPMPRTLREHVERGTAGRLGQCDIQFYMPWADMPGTHYTTEPYMLINDMMVHHFDMLRYVLGRDPLAVHAHTWNPHWGWHAGDAAQSIVFEFDDGLVATHVAVGCTVGRRTDWNGDWRIEGDRGSIEWNGKELRHVQSYRIDEPVDEPIPLKQVPDQPQAMLDEFHAAVAESREPECSAADNLKTLAMAMAAMKSAAEKRRVELTEFA